MSKGTSYDPKTIEPEIYRFWETGGYFRSTPDPGRKPYTIVIPPPNVTGALHLGHALNNTLQDVLIRRKRMQGYNACWLPGTDHAGIATQAVVERRLKEEEGKTRHEVGRDGLVQRIWDWKEEYNQRILNQLRMMGCSCDWERTRFTLDEQCANAVYQTFFRMFRDGLIYRGLRLVNWDAHLQTAVADDEIVHETVKGNLWHIRYPLDTSDGPLPSDTPHLIVATTRPETMLGDTAVAVHPEDPRYKALIGRHAILPLVNRRIPIIADPILVDPRFGTGVVKVTPGHDPNDYECGQRNDLPMINILTKDGRIRDDEEGKQLFAAYAGQDRLAARKQIVKDLEAAELLEKAEPHEHEVGHSDRSKTPIEPMLSEQWFVKMESLAELAMEAVRDGRVQFHPERYAKTYLDWLGEKRDWCISRQLWWGHRIPVWSKQMTWNEWLKLGADEPIKNELLGDETSRQACVTVVRDDGQRFTIAGAPNAYEQAAALRDLSATDDRIANWYVCLHAGGGDTLTETAGKLKAWLEKAGFEQDPDVLDTWFSSALWPHSTFGWPAPDSQAQSPEGSETPTTSRERERAVSADLDYYYPTSVLSTARDIISLWVARMVMTGLYNLGRVPFSDVYIHPVVQDGTGKRMSKTAGNGVDPVDLITLYGTDAMRYTLTGMAGETQDARVPISYDCPHCDDLVPHSQVVPHNKAPREIHEVKCGSCKQKFATVWAPKTLKDELGIGLDTSERFELGRNFCNKLWQAATGLVIPSIADLDRSAIRTLATSDLTLDDRWILSRLQACIRDVDQRLDRYQFSDAVGRLYAFFWSEFCDWYLELVKPRLQVGATAQSGDTSDEGGSSDTSKGGMGVKQVLAWVLDQTLRLLHPITPFVTESLWSRLNETVAWRGIGTLTESGSALIAAEWPQVDESLVNDDAERRMAALQDVIRALRDIRARVNGLRAQAKETVLRTLPHGVVRATPEVAATLEPLRAVICRLGQCDNLEIGTGIDKPAQSASKVFAGYEVYVPLAGLADLDIERKRLRKEIDQLAGVVRGIEGKLANEGFVAKAPPAIVQRERERLTELQEKAVTLRENLQQIEE